METFQLTFNRGALLARFQKHGKNVNSASYCEVVLKFRDAIRKWELLEHPPYSPDFAPTDFHLFGPLKEHLGGKRFADDEEVETGVRK
jgi:hypothetical protein